MNENNEDYTIILNDESGNEIRFDFLDLIEFENAEYVVLLPQDTFEETGEIVILQLEGIDEDTKEEIYVSVDDEETLMAVFSIFKEKFKNEFKFED